MENALATTLQIRDIFSTIKNDNTVVEWDGSTFTQLLTQLSSIELLAEDGLGRIWAAERYGGVVLPQGADLDVFDPARFDATLQQIWVTLHPDLSPKTGCLECFEEFKSYLSNSGKLRIVMDYTDVEFVSSAGLGAMITTSKAASEVGGKMVLTGINENVLQVMKLTRLDRLLSIEKNIAKAQKRVLK